MSLPINKLYIDTTYRTSGSNSNFKIDSAVSLTFPEHTAFYIDDACVPHYWYAN